MPEVQQSPQPVEPTQSIQSSYQRPEGYGLGYQRALYQIAFDSFMRNLAMIIPALFALIITLILGLVLVSFSSFIFLITHNLLLEYVLRLVIGIISGVIITLLIQIEAFEAKDIILGLRPDVDSAWRRTVSSIGSIIPVIIIMGGVFGIISITFYLAFFF